MGVAEEYPDLYGTKPGTKAASLWDQWHVLQEQNKPKRPVEKYHIDFNSNKVEKSVAPQIGMPSMRARQMTAPGVTSYQAMAAQPGAFLMSNSPIEASKRLAPQPEALEKSNSSTYAPQVSMPLLGARQRTAPCVSTYHSMASQPGAFITSTLPINAPQFESSKTSTSSTSTPQIPMQLLGDRQRTAPHVLNHHSMASQPGTFIASNQPIGSAPQLGASETSTPQKSMAMLGARQRTAHCVTTYQTMAPRPGAYNTSNPHSGASQTSTSSICAPHTAVPYLKNHLLLEPSQVNSAPQVSNSMTETLPYYTSHQVVAPHQVTSRISSSIWAPELTVSLVSNPKTLTPQMPKRAPLQQFSSQHSATLPEFRAQQFKIQHRTAPQLQPTAPQFRMTAQHVGATRLGNRGQGLPNKAMHFRSPQYNYHQQKSPQSVQQGAPNLTTNYLSPRKENRILYSENFSKGIESSNQNSIQQEYLPTQILGSSTGPDRYWVNHPVLGQPGPLTPPYLEPNGEFESEQEHFKFPKPVKSKPDKKFMLPPIFKPEISKKCVKQGWKQRALLHYSQKSD